MGADRPHLGEASPTSELGEGHPLARVTAQFDDAVYGSVAVAAILIAGVTVAMGGLAFGVPLAVTAAAALLALLAFVASLARARRRAALELIAQGRGELPLRAVLRERHRLLRPAQREQLARSFDTMRIEACQSNRGCHAARLAYYNVAAVRASSSEMAEIAVLVREGGDVRGLAVAELLVTDGRSPLYGYAAELLRRELGRIRFLLAADQHEPCTTPPDDQRGGEPGYARVR